VSALAIVPPDHVRRVLDALRDVKQRGKAWSARCPAHDDDRASLSVSLGRDDRVLLKCHAGCEAREVVRRIGLEMSALFAPRSEGTPMRHAPPPNAPAPTSERPALIKSYPYVDENGGPLFEACRYLPKTFRQRRRAPDGRWIDSLKNSDGTLAVRLVPYRLPEVIEAAAAERMIYLVEGEKDADALHALGLTATTTPMGASNWRDEYADHFAGAAVTILPDNDAAGRTYAKSAAAALTARGCSVRVVALPGLPAKGDVSDWLAGGGTVPTLEALVSAAMPRTTDGAAASSSEESEAHAMPGPLRLRDVPPPAPIEWVIKDFWIAGDFGALAGDDGSYKSTVATHMAVAVACGGRVFGRFETQQRPVLLVSQEDPADVILNRIQAMCRGQGWSYETVSENLYLMAMTGANLMDARWQAHLRDIVAKLDAGLVILDPWAELIAGEENSSSEMRPAIKAARALTLPSRAAVMVVHHLGKDVQGKRRIDRVRGTSAFKAATRALYFVERQDDGRVAMTCEKMSRTRKPAPFVVALDVEADADNPAQWSRARFTSVSVREAALGRAEEWVLTALDDSPGLSTTELKKAATGTGISGADIHSALRLLEMRRQVAGEVVSARGKKAWRLTLPEDRGQARQGGSELAGQRGSLPGKVDQCSLTLPASSEARSGHGDGLVTTPPDSPTPASGREAAA
jgi:putative DNA primase/helicase